VSCHEEAQPGGFVAMSLSTPMEKLICNLEVKLSTLFSLINSKNTPNQQYELFTFRDK
jgi:hypothetical protein